jgi:hypothetical protein
MVFPNDESNSSHIPVPGSLLVMKDVWLHCQFG